MGETPELLITRTLHCHCYEGHSIRVPSNCLPDEATEEAGKERTHQSPSARPSATGRSHAPLVVAEAARPANQARNQASPSEAAAHGAAQTKRLLLLLLLLLPPLLLSRACGWVA